MRKLFVDRMVPSRSKIRIVCLSEIAGPGESAKDMAVNHVIRFDQGRCTCYGQGCRADHSMHWGDTGNLTGHGLQGRSCVYGIVDDQDTRLCIITQGFFDSSNLVCRDRTLALPHQAVFEKPCAMFCNPQRISYPKRHVFHNSPQPSKLVLFRGTRTAACNIQKPDAGFEILLHAQGKLVSARSYADHDMRTKRMRNLRAKRLGSLPQCAGVERFNTVPDFCHQTISTPCQKATKPVISFAASDGERYVQAASRLVSPSTTTL